jgi:hypothetical protein
MKVAICTAIFLFLGFGPSVGAQTSAISSPATAERAASGTVLDTPAVIGATPDQEASLRSQIEVMHAAVLPRRVVFVSHWKYIDTAKTFGLHVPTGFGSVMFTHLPSRTVFVDKDRYLGPAWLGYWMAHELGHLATGSTNEADADRAARDYRKRLDDARQRGQL